MSTTWIVVVAVGIASVCCKAAGPVLLGRRPLPARALGLVEFLAPVMLAALVVTQAVAGDRELVFDERLLGLGAAAIALRLGASLLPTMVVAAAVTALVRLMF